MAVLKVLSAAAVKRGVSQVCAAFERDTGSKIEVTFTQMPLLRQRVVIGETLALFRVVKSALRRNQA